MKKSLFQQRSAELASMETWDRMQHWNLVLPPSRPSVDQLNWIRSALEATDRHSPVAVLGSTPEFRDLLCELGFHDVRVLDRNVSFYQAMSEARVYSNLETLVAGDWLDTLQTLPGVFSVVLSDLTSGNVPYELRERFYSGISDCLRPGGLFLDKVLTHSRNLIGFDEIVTKYSALPLNLLHVNHFSCEMLFCSELLEEAEVVDSSHFYGVLDRRVAHPRVRAFVQHAQLITPAGCKWWYGRKWQALETTYCRDLTQLPTFDEERQSPYFGFLKYFAMRKD